MPNCRALDNHVYIDAFGRFQPCCRIGTNKVYYEKFVDFKNSQYFIEIKDQMSNGWHKDCYRCKLEEDSGITSLRQRFENFMTGTPDTVESIDVILSNECNLNCRMCTESLSTKWEKTFEKFSIELKDYKIEEQYIPFDIKNLFDQIDCSKIKTIKIQGGEPLISKKFDDLIDLLENKKIISNINLIVMTNATVYSKRLFRKLTKFKKVNMSLSVDGVEELCDYIRTGSDWTKIKKNLDRWYQVSLYTTRFTFQIKHTAQAYNLHQFESIKSLARSYNFNLDIGILNDPKRLSYSALPRKYVEYLIDNKILIDQQLISAVKSFKFNDEDFLHFKKYTETLDKISSVSISTVIPDLSRFL
jgi:molybdenum cofactor biosynthesis enzyme MoaA